MADQKADEKVYWMAAWWDFCWVVLLVEKRDV